MEAGAQRSRRSLPAPGRDTVLAAVLTAAALWSPSAPGLPGAHRSLPLGWDDPFAWPSGQTQAAARGTPSDVAAGEGEWRLLEPGLELGTIAVAEASGKRLEIRILRIDPAFFRLVLLNASAPGQGNRFTAREWCRREGLIAATNTSMYQEDLLTSVSLMRTRGHTNNPHLTRDKAILAFDPVSDSLPPVRIIDRECDDFDLLRDLYGTLIQSIRMISCKGKNVWAPQPRKWSAAAIAVDGRDRIQFLHVRSPLAMHDLIDILMRLPLGLERAMYVEGGPAAQLYVRSRNEEYEFVGSYETGFFESDANPAAWPVPNVVGIRRIGGD